ncbi:16205_t:CDS:2, partial [Racocetra persica]
QSSNTNKYNIALLQLESILLRNRMSLQNFPNMLIPTPLSQYHIHHNHLIEEELQYNVPLLEPPASIEEVFVKFNEESNEETCPIMDHNL